MDDGLGGDYSSVIGFSTNSLLTTYTISSGIKKGREYRFRYRARNAIGWGPFSSESSILAANVPQAPAKPTFNSFATNTLNINVNPSEDNGGSVVTAYELYRDAGDDFASSFTKLTNYDGSSLVYGATNANDGIVLGKVYRFKTLAINSVGNSDFSDEAYIAFGDVPNTPAAPTLVSSSKTTITVEWAEPAASDLDVTGYILNVDNGQYGDIAPVYIGTNRPDVLEYTVSDLSTGYPYRFTVQAINDNGYSDQSSVATFYSCEAPSGLATPTYVSSDQTAKTISIEWTTPASSGGCAITGYHLYRDDGAGGTVTTEVTSLVNTDPSIQSHTIDLSSGGVVGNIYRFKIKAVNNAGSIESNSLSVALASLPD